MALSTHRSFFFSSRRRHTRYIGDWSSDVCSSDLSLRVCSWWNLSSGNGIIPLGGTPAHPEVGRRHAESRLPKGQVSTSGERSSCFGCRSEERRVGKEGRSRCLPAQQREILQRPPG